MKTGRIAYVDLAKCLALAGLIIGHTPDLRFVSFVDSMLLPVFWICSGYTTTGAVDLRRKLPLLGYYFLMAPVCLLFGIVAWHIPFSWTDIAGIFYGRVTLYAAPISEANPALMQYFCRVLWFLPSLFTSYCVFKVILMARTWIGQALMCVTSLIIATLLDMQPYLLPWSADTAFLFAVFMCFGRWMRRYELIERARFCDLLVSAAVFICLSPVTGFTNLSVRIYGALWPSLLVTATAGVYALLVLCRYLDRTWAAKVAVTLDRQALFIFGLQLIFLATNAEGLIGPVGQWWLSIPFALARCFAGAYIFGWAVRRVVRILTKSGT